MGRKNRLKQSRKPAPVAPRVNPRETENNDDEAAAALLARVNLAEGVEPADADAAARPPLPVDSLPEDLWRHEIFPLLAPADTVNAAAVCRSWAADARSGVKGRGEVVLGQGNLQTRSRPATASFADARNNLRGFQDFVVAPGSPLQWRQRQRLPKHEAPIKGLLTQVRSMEAVDRAIATEKNLGPKRGLPQLCRASAGSVRRLTLAFPDPRQGVPGAELEAVASLVAELPLLSSVDVRATPRQYDLDDRRGAQQRRGRLPGLARAVAEGVVAASSSSSLRADGGDGGNGGNGGGDKGGDGGDKGGGGGGGGGRGGRNLRALALRGELQTEYVPEESAWRDLPPAWAEGLGIAVSAASARRRRRAGSSSSSRRPYGESDDVALLSSALALLARSSPIEKLSLDIDFWQPEGGGGTPSSRRDSSAAEAATRAAAPLTLAALLQPLAGQLVDLSVDCEQWRLATRGRFAPSGASARPSSSSSSSSSSLSSSSSEADAEAEAAEAGKYTGAVGLGPLPKLRVLRLVDSKSGPGRVAFVLSRASFENGVRPSVLHFIKNHAEDFPCQFAAEEQAGAVARLATAWQAETNGLSRGMYAYAQRLRGAPDAYADPESRVVAPSRAQLDAALEPLASCVTELIIDVAQSNAQVFPYAFGALRSLRRLSIRLARPGTSPRVPFPLVLRDFAREHGDTLTSLDVSGFVGTRIEAGEGFRNLRRLVMRGNRGMRAPFSVSLPTPTPLSGQHPRLEVLLFGFMGHRPDPKRMRFTDQRWFEQFCRLQSLETQGILDLDRLLAPERHYPKLRLLLLENCDLVLTRVVERVRGFFASPRELVEELFDYSEGLAKVHLHGCRFETSKGTFVPATAGELPRGTVLTAGAARAEAFLRALAASSSSSSSRGDGGERKGGEGVGSSFRGICYGCDAWGAHDDWVDEMEFSRERTPFNPGDVPEGFDVNLNL